MTGSTAKTMSMIVAAVSNTPVRCALSKARPATTSPIYSDVLAVGRDYALGTITIHPAKGDGVLARRVTFDGSASGPVGTGRPMGGRCRFNNISALMSKLGKGNGCGANH